uniref:Carboxylic ester hydrolase n=1 Tax=Botrytis fabae TaxID=182092 RepID=A0A5J6SKV7_9HELO|nr:carboxylic ester hydrolase 2 isoform 1 [Botrytis fabae]
MFVFSRLQYLSFFVSVVFQHASALSNSDTSLTLLYQNNLNASDDVNHVGFILLDPHSPKDASAACKALNETLLSSSIIKSHTSDFLLPLSYQAYRGRSSSSQLYIINDGVISYDAAHGLSFPKSTSGNAKLPVLCTQSSKESQSGTAVATDANEVSLVAGGNTYIGYRNQKSFRFLGIPYANPAARFVYSTPYSPTGKTIQATAYGAQCPQSSSGSEDCLFLNIQTPHIPKAKSTKDLRPVMFWIHGGGFVGGSGADQLSDGGDLASREDIVVVNVNYRLSVLGFLAIPGTNITGNYGIADQINALEWTVKNIAAFGGDPKRITIIGESAGAGSVRTLLGSPPAIGKFQGAVAMSNLGGGVDLGLPGDSATTYSSYLTIPESYALAGQNIFLAAGCNQSSLSAQISCLKKVPALDLVAVGSEARYVVQDGHYVNTAELDLVNHNGSTAHVDVIFGITANDGASIGTNYPSTPATSEVSGIAASLGISTSYAQSIIDSGLFPFHDTRNLTLDAFNVSQRVATDKDFRCVDQATVYAGSKNGVFKSSYFYEMGRTVAGYDPNGLGGPKASPGFPDGNPRLPYFRFHGADMPWVFGAFNTGLRFRDEADWWSVQLSVAYFGAFVRTGNPNPEEGFVRSRGYEVVREGIEETGRWKEVGGGEERGSMMVIDWPGEVRELRDLDQCAWLGYPVDYYVKGGV